MALSDPKSVDLTPRSKQYSTGSLNYGNQYCFFQLYIVIRDCSYLYIETWMDTTMMWNKCLAVDLFHKVNIGHLSIPNQINQTAKPSWILYVHTRAKTRPTDSTMPQKITSICAKTPTKIALACASNTQVMWNSHILLFRNNRQRTKLQKGLSCNYTHTVDTSPMYL
jgi:hypothetical protein